MKSLSRRVTYGVVALAMGAVAALTVTGASASPSPIDNGSNYHALAAPARLLDTRSPKQTLGDGGSLDVQVAGQVGIPANATSVVLNVTVAGTTTAGYLSVVPSGTNPTLSSTLNWSNAGTLESNTATVALPVNGKVTVYNHTGSTDVVLDVSGFYTNDPVQQALDGAYYSVAKYDVGDTNGGAVASVACKATTDVAIAGGVQTLAAGTNGLTHNVPVSSSFPGRMDWTTNTPIAGRLDGWIVQFGGNSSATDLGSPLYENIYALCVPGASIPVDTTYTESGS